MMVAITKKKCISLHLQHDAKQTIERAASFEGQKVSQFILASALSCAEKTIHEHEIITLNAKDSKAFFEAIAKPVRPNDALKKAFESHDRQIVSE